MRQNSKERPHNWCVVQAQLDEEEARTFHEIMDVTGMNTSGLLKLFVAYGNAIYRANKNIRFINVKTQAAQETIEQIRKVIDDARK